MTTPTPTQGRPSPSPLRRKSIEAIIAQSAEEARVAGEGAAQLKKSLTGKDLMGFGIGMVIGTGIFTLTGIEAKNHAGPAITISFVIAGVVALLAALCYAELSSSVPAAGSAYTYAYATLGEVFAWIIGWDLILEFALGAAVVCRGWSGYMQHLIMDPSKPNQHILPDAFFGETSVVNLGAILIALILGYIALVGVKESARVTNLLVIIKVAICIFVIVVGAFFIKTRNYVPFVPPAEPVHSELSGLEQPLTQFLFNLPQTAFGFSGMLAAAAVVFFAYSGFEIVANMGEETKNPKRDLPLGIIGTLVICTALYVGVCIVITGMVHYTQIDESAPIAAAFTDVGLPWAGALISLAGVCGLMSVILVDIVGMGRVGFAMGRDKLIPAAVAKIHPKWGTPYRVTIATVVAICLLGGFVPLKALADMVSIGTLFAFVIVSVAVPILRRRQPDLKRPFSVPASPVIPIVSALGCVYLMSNLSVATWLRFLIWMAIGICVYFFYSRKHAALAELEETSAK